MGGTAGPTELQYACFTTSSLKALYAACCADRSRLELANYSAWIDGRRLYARVIRSCEAVWRGGLRAVRAEKVIVPYRRTRHRRPKAEQGGLKPSVGNDPVLRVGVEHTAAALIQAARQKGVEPTLKILGGVNHLPGAEAEAGASCGLPSQSGSPGRFRSQTSDLARHPQERTLSACSLDSPRCVPRSNGPVAP
jgi:hypothetical protein